MKAAKKNAENLRIRHRFACNPLAGCGRIRVNTSKCFDVLNRPDMGGIHCFPRRVPQSLSGSVLVA